MKSIFKLFLSNPKTRRSVRLPGSQQGFESHSSPKNKSNPTNFVAIKLSHLLIIKILVSLTIRRGYIARGGGRGARKVPFKHHVIFEWPLFDSAWCQRQRERRRLIDSTSLRCNEGQRFGDKTTLEMSKHRYWSKQQRLKLYFTIRLSINGILISIFV